MLFYTICTVVWRINCTYTGSGDMRICDLNGALLCQSINYTTSIHIELTLSMRCANDSVRNDIQCDIDDALNMTLMTEASTLVIPCTMLEDNGVDCRVMISVLDNSTVSQNLTKQLFEQLRNNRSLLMVSALN